MRIQGSLKDLTASNNKMVKAHDNLFEQSTTMISKHGELTEKTKEVELLKARISTLEEDSKKNEEEKVSMFQALKTCIKSGFTGLKVEMGTVKVKIDSVSRLVVITKTSRSKKYSWSSPWSEVISSWGG